MKVYYVNQNALTPDIPGGTRHFELSRSMQAFGVQAEVFAADLNLATRSYHRRSSEQDKRVISEVYDRVPFHWIYTNSYQANDSKRISNMLNFSWRVYRDLCRRAKPDAIIGSSPNLFAALAAERAAAHHRVPFVFEIRDIWPQTLVDMTGSAGLTARVLQAMANFLYRRADHLVTLAKGTNRHLEDLGIAAAKITYIPNGIVAENFPVLDDHDRRRIRGSYGLPEQDFLCVYAGAHGRANGLDNVLNTALLLQDHPDIGFVLVGDGPSKQDLLAQAKRDGLKNVYFHDPVPKTDIPALLGSMDLGLLILQNVEVFKYGISPNKLFDYWAARLPVIATTPGEIGDLIETAKGGKQIAAEDAGALSQAVSEAASHPEHYRDMGLQGHHFVTEHFERTKLAQSLAMVLENCRGNRP